VCTFDDAHAAIGVGHMLALPVQSDAQEAGIRPFPDVAGQIVQALAVGPERTARLRRGLRRLRAVRFNFVARDPCLGGIGRIDEWERVVGAFSAAAKVHSSSVASRCSTPVFWEIQVA
jgi:hypothetical protein